MNLVSVDGWLGRVAGDEIEVLDLPVADFAALVRRENWRDELAAAGVVGTRALAATRLDPPVRPGNFWLVGSNYRGRAPQRPDRPAFYLRSSASVSGPGDEIVAPSELQVDPDGEMAVVIGCRGSGIHEDEAWSYVAGITGCNDLTARALMDGGKGVAVAKSLPGFGALGGSVRVVDGDPGVLGVELTMNGELRQRGTTDEMCAAVPELISRLSKFAELLPGDVIATGGPAVLADAGSMGEGVVVTVVEVDGVLPLESRLVPA